MESCSEQTSASSSRIRNQMRYLSEQERLSHRRQAADRVRKNLKETSEELHIQNVMTPDELSSAVSRIKQSKRTSHLDLRALKQTLQDQNNCIAFLRMTGGLAAVVGHLTGKKALHQLESAYICCNLAAGGEFACVAVANAAGPYLIEFLDGQNTALQVACLWTLANLAGGSSKSLSILQSQGIIDRLITCLQNPNEEVVDAALHALILILKSATAEEEPDLMSQETRQQLAVTSMQLSCCRENVDWVIYLLSCKSACDDIFLEHNIPQNFLDRLVEFARDSQMDVNELSRLRSVTAMVRTLANLAAGQTGEAAMKILAHPFVLDILNDLFHARHPHVRLECEWLARNLMRHSVPMVVQRAQGVKLDVVWNARDRDHVNIQNLMN